MADKYAKSAVDIYKNCGADAIETNIHDAFEIEKLPQIVPYMKDFAYKSIHSLSLEQGRFSPTQNFEKRPATPAFSRATERWFLVGGVPFYVGKFLISL